MTGRTLEIATKDGPMPAYLVEAEERATRGAVLVNQEAFGVNDHIEDVCHRFAAAGWTALAPALFHRQGSPVLAYDDLASVMPVMQQVTAVGLASDIDASLSALGELGFAPDRCAVTGFCMGGSVTFLAAARHPFGAAVTFYGGGISEGRFGMPSHLELAPSLESPWLGLYGDLDQGIPVADVEALRAAAAEADVPTEIVRYADADHGFHCDGRPAVFHAAAAEDAWRRTLDWFDRYIPR